MRNGFIIALCASVGVHLFLLLFDLLYKKLGKAGAVERASVIYSNSAVFIVPIISYTLGAEWVVYSSPFIMVQLVFLWTHGARLFSSDEKFNLKKILSNVNLIAVFLGLIMLLCGIRLPAFASEIADSLGTMIGNAGMILAGMTMAGIKLLET